MRQEIFIRYERCMGCKSCEIACAVAHSESKTFFGALFEEKKPKKRLFVDQVIQIKAPTVCRHCEEAYCIDACISGAMHRTDDGVVTNEGGAHQCIGCWMCVMACPYGVIRQGERVALKCDRDCVNDKGTPACVAACPTRALVFTTVDEFDKIKREEYLKKMFAEQAG